MTRRNGQRSTPAIAARSLPVTSRLVPSRATRTAAWSSRAARSKSAGSGVWGASAVKTTPGRSGTELRVDVREQVGERSRVGGGEPHGAGVRPHGRVVLAAEVAVNADGYGEGGERARCREDERRTARPSGHPVDDQCGEERDREGNRGEMVP